MCRVVVFRLCGIELPIRKEERRVEVSVGGSEEKERALVANFVPEDTIVGAVPPCGPVRIGDGLKGFMRQNIVGRVDQFTTGSIEAVESASWQVTKAWS